MSTDVGAVRSGMNFAITRDLVDINQGNPATLVKSFVTTESGVLTLTGLQWDFANFAKALGISDPSGDTMDLGGALTMRELAIKVVHYTPAGTTYELRIWRARGGGNLTFNFTDDPHEFEYTFNAILATTDWAGSALSAGAQLFQLVRTT